MSVFGEAIIDRLHSDCALRDRDNSMRHILDNGLGCWLDEFDEDSLSENIFLESATGGWLDVHGKEYNVLRKVGESDEDYRSRIVYEAIGHLTVDYLKDVYGVDLYAYVENFDVRFNTLTSENPFVSKEFLGEADISVQEILSKKFILKDSSVWWLNELGSLDYILNSYGENILNDYYNIFKRGDLRYYFRGNTDISKVHLSLPSATNCTGMLGYCSSLTSVYLYLPKEVGPTGLLEHCSSLTSATLNLPKYDRDSYIFEDCPNLEYINLTIPSAFVEIMKSYIQSLNLQYLTTLIINGEEVSL